VPPSDDPEDDDVRDSGEHDAPDVSSGSARRSESRPRPPSATGWERAESTQRPKRRRITLDMVGPPLSLPSIPTANAEAPLPQLHPLPAARLDPPSVELALPDLEQLMGRASIVAERELVTPALEDGWGRARDMPTSAPPRPRASTPPPFDVALAQGMKLPGLASQLGRVAPRSRAPGTTVSDLEGEMIDRYALGDFTGALRAAELVLGKQADNAEANKCAASCRERLGHLHLSRLGGSGRVPRVAVDGSEVRWLGLDHRAGFLLSRVDGASTIDELVDLSGMARHEALKILVELMDAGALKF
jgi:hypothetical protein